MKYKLFSEVALLKDFPAYKLKKGDVATIVERHAQNNSDDGYSIEVFNAMGDTFAVLVVSEKDIENLTRDKILSIRPIEAA